MVLSLRRKVGGGQPILFDAGLHVRADEPFPACALVQCEFVRRKDSSFTGWNFGFATAAPALLDPIAKAAGQPRSPRRLTWQIAVARGLALRRLFRGLASEASR